MPTLLNGNQKTARKSKMVVEEKPVEQAVENQEEQESKSKKFSLLKKLEPEMLLNPYPIEMPGIADSEEFCLEKHSQFILEPLADAIRSEKEWLDFARATWQWREQAEERRLESTADDAIARLQEDPRVLEIVKKKLVKG